MSESLKKLQEINRQPDSTKVQKERQIQIQRDITDSEIHLEALLEMKS